MVAPRELIYTLFGLLTAKVAISTAVFGSQAENTSLGTRATSTLDFTGAGWIWSSTYTASTFLAVRKDFVPPLGKSLIAAEIVMTGGQAAFYVNGEFIGENAPPTTAWGYTGRYCVDLLPSFNVFASNGTSSDAVDAAVIGAIRVTYNDLSTDTIVTDTSWRANPWVAGFEQLSFDDSAWSTAIVKATYPAAPYGPLNAAANPPAINLNFGPTWVWTNAIPAGGITEIPAGPRAFRRTFTPAAGQIPMTATILITGDDAFTLFINGVEIGSTNPGGWETAQQFQVNFVSAPSELVFAVFGTNAATGRAGVLAVAEINMAPSGRANCSAGAWVVTDANWVSITGAIPTGWQLPGFDDSAWPSVVAEAIYPADWGTVAIAAASPAVNV
ncbi:hypothetical protein B0H16DRAFT_1687149 [Mycena metata]|uniref:Uncharacterized protein n=1 Tax=Mycena metata TaxID=1033252 RepID=A0AAD7JKX2_9AGAR|nr:hypothetical protein B0H16DRAFT_1687149 [Mycena metata]